MAGVGSDGEGESMTVDFCEKQASSSAHNFVHNFLVFDRNHPAVGRTRDPYDYAKKFTEFFMRYFDYELRRTTLHPSSSQHTEVNSLSSETHATTTTTSPPPPTTTTTIHARMTNFPCLIIVVLWSVAITPLQLELPC